MDPQSHLPNALRGFDFMNGGSWYGVNRGGASTTPLRRLHRASACGKFSLTARQIA
jgi:hypothetical protein